MKVFALQRSFASSIYIFFLLILTTTWGIRRANILYPINRRRRAAKVSRKDLDFALAVPVAHSVSFHEFPLSVSILDLQNGSV